MMKILEIMIIIKKENTESALLHKSTSLVSSSFCGKTHLLLNKLHIIHLLNSEKQMKTIPRSPEQYSNFELKDTGDALLAELLRCVSVEKDLQYRTIQGFRNCCIVFDDMLDSCQKIGDPFFTRGRHNDSDVYSLSQSYFDLPKRTIRKNEI